MRLNATNQQQIDRARAILATLATLSEVPPATVAAVLLGAGCADVVADDDPDSYVQLSKDGRHARIVCDAGLPMPTGDAPVWVQVATAGNFEGYPGGGFVFDGTTFSQIITNFRSNASYVQGAAGVGVADVTPWDFNHASAAFAADGSIPITGTPAQGWTQELDVRQGQDGVLQLWALVRWLPLARAYIQQGQYQWASVVVAFDCTDAHSGKPIGAVLESTALTNVPFISGMEKLAASRHGLPARPTQGANNMQPTKHLNLSIPRGISGAAARQLAQSVLRLAAQQRAGTAPMTSQDANEDGIPDWNPPAGIQANLWEQLIARGKKTPGLDGASEALAKSWLRLQPGAIETLGLADAGLEDLIVRAFQKKVSWGSWEVGHGSAPGVEATPGALSRQPLDARDQPGVNAHARCLRAMRQSPKFAALDFGTQCVEASKALASGMVLA